MRRFYNNLRCTLHNAHPILKLHAWQRQVFFCYICKIFTKDKDKNHDFYKTIDNRSNIKSFLKTVLVNIFYQRKKNMQIVMKENILRRQFCNKINISRSYTSKIPKYFKTDLKPVLVWTWIRIHSFSHISYIFISLININSGRTLI